MNFFYNLLTSFSIAEISFIIDICNYKYIADAIYFHCYDKTVAANLHKSFNQHNIRLSTAGIRSGCSYNVSRHFHRKNAIIINTACQSWTTVLDSDAISFQHDSFIVITEHLSTTIGILAQYSIQVDSDVTIAHKTDSSINLYEIYNTGFYYNGTVNVVNVGLWNSSLFVQEHKRKNLQGLKIKVAVIVLPTPKVEKESVEQYMERDRADVDMVNKMKFFILMKYMRDMYNISYDLHRTSSWGYQRNGSFDGMVGALRNGMADIGGAPCFFRSDRAENVHYISEVWMSRHSFIFRHPKHPGGFHTIYTRPLSATVWHCVVALLVVTSMMTWLMLKMQGNRVNGQETSLSLASLVIWGAVCQQGMHVCRDTTSLKIITFVTFVYSLTLDQYYNAMLVSSLLMEEPRNIKTLKDLRDSDLQVGAEDIVYNIDYFKRTNDPVAIDLYKKKIHTSTQYNFFKIEDGMALVKKGGFAFHVDTTVAFPIIKKTFNEREICDTQLVQLYPLQKCGVVVRKNSPYKEHIAYGIRKMYEAGILHRLRSVVDVPMPKCTHTPDSSVYRVSIREFSMPLLALTFGVISSFVIFVAEVLIHKISKKFTTFEH